MSGAQHTPGPWHVHGSHIYVARGPIIAVVSNPGSRASDYPLEANRNLMAAAPELLEALERAARNIDAMAKALQSEQLFAAGKRAAGWAEEAKQAIAKARGEA